MSVETTTTILVTLGVISVVLCVFVGCLVARVQRAEWRIVDLESRIEEVFPTMR